jgi:hypothetical protein
MPSQIDAPIDSDAAGVNMEFIETTNAIERLEWQEVVH